MSRTFAGVMFRQSPFKIVGLTNVVGVVGAAKNVDMDDHPPSVRPFDAFVQRSFDKLRTLDALALGTIRPSSIPDSGMSSAWNAPGGTP